MGNFIDVLIGNSFFLIGAILNQNENWRDQMLTHNSNIILSPLKKVTFIAFLLQLFLLLIQIGI